MNVMSERLEAGSPRLESTRQRLFAYSLIIAVAAGNGLAGIFSGSILHPSSGRPPMPRPPQTPMFGANDVSRWTTVWSLVERGTYQIDEIIQRPGWDTIDKGRFRDHFYSSKPPFIATIAAGLYWLLKSFCGFDLLNEPQSTVPAILLIVNWLPWIVALVLLASMVERYAQSDMSRYYVIVTAAGGTFLTTFLVTLNNHTLAACAVVFALFPLLRIVVDRQQGGWLFASAGFWGAFAACCEIPAATLGLALFGLAFWHGPRQAVLWFIPAALLPLGLFFVTNWLCTGRLTPFQASYGAPGDTFYSYVYQGVPSFWSNPPAIERGESQPLIYLFHCTLGHHGILSLSPCFLLTVGGWLRLRTIYPLRIVGWLSLILTVLVLDFYLLQTNRYNYGGTTSGLRWAFWLIPLWLLGMVPALDAWGSQPAFRGFAVLFLVISVFSVAAPLEDPWQKPWLWHLWPEAYR